ncbi:uncharacterized protein LOC114533248 [Dendronephthya gigantea]|uniref:uncharacterized protein LOC114533248 n=1 Tax=Dendronephthya gigantea TaxID=151771 RepID=UPI00106B0BBB|nr:uncharacterized protein LOC114533248 [Dendronephthya gigantea]
MNANPQWPVSPIHPRKDPESTTVSVRVEWPSKKYERKLSKDLESLGKMLVRGTYKQIARAAWKSASLKKQLQLLVLKEVDRECTNLCSKKNPSCLRSPTKEDMLKFSIEGLNKELKERAPLAFSVLVAASVNTRSRSKKNARLGEDFWSPAVGMAAAICLKNRSKYMNALQLLITIFNYHSGWQATLARLATLRIMTSHSYLYKKLDEYGSGYRDKILKAVDNQCQFIRENEADTQLSCDIGRKITIDNFDYRQNVHHMTEQHQNIDVHLVSVMSTENRVGGIEFSDEKNGPAIMKLENGTFIPSDGDHQLHRSNFITLVGRILVDSIPCLKFLADVVTSHIQHKYSSEMAKKTDTTFMGLIYENENDADGITNVIKELHQYVPHGLNDDETDGKYGEQGIVGDQLTVERFVNAHCSLANGFTEKEQCNGLHPEIADWHSGNRFLQLAFQNLYSPSSNFDKCTMYADRTLINRRNVKSEVSSAANPCRQFFTLEVKARVIAAGLTVLKMDKLEDEPAKDLSFSGDNSSKVEKTNYLKSISAKVVDEFIIDGRKNERILQCMDNIDLCEKAKELSLDDNNRYRCRYEGCSKTFAQYGKRMKDHEAKHDPPILEEVKQSVTVDTTSDEDQDDMFSYQKALLEYGMLILNFWDAISEGDGERIMRCWRFFLLYLRTEGQSAAKYSLEGLYLMCQANALLSQQAAHRLIWNRSVKNKDGPGGNIPLDLQLEFFNRIMKAAVKNLGPNASKSSLNRISHSMGVTNVLMRQFEHELSVYRRSGKHITTSSNNDLRKVVKELLSERAFHVTPGRKYHHFKNMKQSLLHGLDLQKLFSWINEHKKNLVLHRRAR